MDIKVQFHNDTQEQFYYNTARNQLFSGGFNNGKTWVGCLKGQSLLNLFPSYKLFIGRQTYSDLKKSTMQTFFKMLPHELISAHNEQDGYTQLINGSVIHWIHCDGIDESTARGLEVNSGLIDQAEETSESVHDILDARIGRWDGVLVPSNLLEMHEKIIGTPWPQNKFGKWIVPSYFMNLSNPDTEFHHLFRYYHPESNERRPGYSYFEGSWQKELGSEEAYEAAIRHDQEWVDKYVLGKWGSSGAAIHILRKESVLEPSGILYERIRERGNLFRILDHGDSAPTCCMWVAAIDGVYIFYREYYVASKLVSYHRRAISDLSGHEQYSNNYADPSIFKKMSQKQGGFWSVADEYRDTDLEGPELFWTPADNNEFATRNRVNELLIPSQRYQHPVTKTRPAPGIYFIQANNNWPQGCREAIRQIGSQRKKLLGSLDGKNIYSDDRDENIPDHAYDCIRYFVAMHGLSPRASEKKPPRNSFAYYNSLLKKQMLEQR